MKKIAVALLLLGTVATFAQEVNGTNPIFWCDISRSQVSHERDAALAQIEQMKVINMQQAARIKELEAAAKPPASSETPQ